VFIILSWVTKDKSIFLWKYYKSLILGLVISCHYLQFAEISDTFRISHVFEDLKSSDPAIIFVEFILI